MDSSGETTEKYLKLNPEEAGFFDLFSILFSSKDIRSKNFIDAHPDVNNNILERTGIIFTSVLVQQFLKFISYRWSQFGTKFESFLNFFSGNTTFTDLLVNKLQGKPEIDKESETYLSAIGSLDSRVDLDRNIKPEDSRYVRLLSAMASKVVYENKAFIEATVVDRWKMELLGSGFYDFWNEYQQKNTTQAMIFHDKHSKPDRIIVAFRGTEPFDTNSWSTDFDISWLKFKDLGKVHSGFMKALGLQENETWPHNVKQDDDQPDQSLKEKLSSLCFGKPKTSPQNHGDTGKNNSKKLLAYYTIRKQLKEVFKKNSETKFIVTGHSLGGALAILFPSILALHKEDAILKRLEGVYTFGQPRVGNSKFKHFMKEKLKEFGVEYIRFVYNLDIVPRVPFDNSLFMFKHFGKCIIYDSYYLPKEVSGELYEKYFTWSPLRHMRRTGDAIWKVVRSLIGPYINGGAHKESWSLLLVRVIGIWFPYFADHNPQDYINAVRLGYMKEE